MKKNSVRWIIKIILISLVASVVFALASNEILYRSGYIMSFGILVVFIVIGVVFDVIGLAITAATEAPFNSMATRRQRGATEALLLVKNAERVTCYTNDVTGDVTGIVSGSTAALIAARLMEGFNTDNLIIPVGIAAIVTGVTVGSKAIAKSFAFRKNTEIVLFVGKVLNFLHIKPFSKPASPTTPDDKAEP